MWKTFAEVSNESGVHRTTLNKAREELGEAVRKSGAVYLIDTDHPKYTAWLERHLEWYRNRKRLTDIVIIKAQGPGPSYAEIKRIGVSMSDPRDQRNHMLLSDEQEIAYQQACQAIKDGDISAAESELRKVFDWVKVEQ